MNGKIGFMICVCALILSSAPATAEFEVPEDAVTFEYLGLSGNYDADAVKCQTKEATLQFTEPTEVEIVLATYRDRYPFYVGIYIDGILATGKHVDCGNKEVTIIIPEAFIQTGENTIRLEFIDNSEYFKFNKYPITIAPKSHAMSRGVPEFEVPEDAVTFEYLGLSGNYDADAVKCQTKEATLQFTEPTEVEIVLATYRDRYPFYVGIYIDGILATGKHVDCGNKEVTIIIPEAFIKTGENTIRLEFIDNSEYFKFNKYPITIAPRSYARSKGAPSPTPTVTQTEVMGFSIQDTQKSSETAPEINIEPIEGQNLPNTTVLLSGSASSDSGIESVTVNEQDVGTESWSVPLDLSFGDNNIAIVAKGKDDNTTIVNIVIVANSSASEKKSGIENIILLIASVLGGVVALLTLLKMFSNRSKSRASDGGDNKRLKTMINGAHPKRDKGASGDHKEVKENGHRDSHK